MSVQNVARIAEAILPRIEHVRTEADGLSIISDLVTRLARNSADHIFWKVTSEAGWTGAATVALCAEAAKGNALARTETLHALGGTEDMAHDFVEAWIGAFNGRMAELHAAPQTEGRSQ